MLKVKTFWKPDGTTRTRGLRWTKGFYYLKEVAMTANFICYKKCSTCKKAEKFLRENGIKYTSRDYTEAPLSVEEVTALYQKSGQPLSKLFNTSGQIYRKEKIKDQLPSLSEAEQIQLLSDNPKLIKRPLLETATTVYIGFKETEWKELA